MATCDFSEFSFLAMKQEVSTCIEQRESDTGIEAIEKIFSLFPRSDIDKEVRS